MRLRPTFTPARARHYRRPGGPWDLPPLDAVLAPRSVAPVRLVDGSVRLTGPELEARVAALAGGLRARGVRRADVVAWQLPNWHESVLLYRACWRLGAVAAPLHHSWGTNEVARIRALAPRIMVRAVVTKTMPLGNLTGITEDERRKLGAWIVQGAKVE